GTAGDSVLAEFASAVDAVQCAVDMQRALTGKNADLPAERRMEFHIGINVGDVIVEGPQIYSDGVNIAARLEALADGGGICISGTVYDQVGTKLPLGYESLGEQVVKNIAKPVRVYRVLMDGTAASPVSGQQATSEEVPHRLHIISRRQLMMGAVAGIVVLAAVAAVLTYRSSPSSAPRVEAPAEPASRLPLPDKPSLVVLPFVNMSEDPKQEYFSDGLTEDLTSALSRISSLFVIARYSAFIYKGKAVKVQDVSKELGVRYVLEGSVRKADNQVRITAQLIDATTGGHLWSERYDRPLQDIFALQDDVVQKIVTTLKLQITVQEQGELVRKTTDNLEAYDAYLRGVAATNRHTQEAN